MMFCPDCGTDLDEVEVDTACPVCGGGRRSANAHAGVAEVTAIVGEVSLKITKGDHRPWQEKWRKVLQCLDALREACSGDARRFGNDEVDRRTETFFVECDHLRDWLDGDLSSLPGVTTGDIEQYFQGSSPLLICNAVCNTHKHHTRRSGTTARIRDTELTPTGARITIEVDWALPTRSTVDALQLADECVASWRSFFAARGVQEPE